MTHALEKLASMVKKVRGVASAKIVPAVHPRPPKRYTRIATYSDGGSVLGRSLLEVVSTREDRARGMMGRAELPSVCGMLFEGLSGGGVFWMKDCLIPLDVMFFGDDGKITKMYTMPVDEHGLRQYPYDESDTGAIEVPAGFCRRRGIAPGCTVGITRISKSLED